MKLKLVKAFSLSRDQWWILTRVWVLLFLVDVGLRILPFRRLQKILVPVSRTPDKLQPGKAHLTIRHLQRWVDIAAHYHLYAMTCLRRSMVLQRLLAREGIAVDLQIGVRKQGDKLNAHAWLEYQGQPINESGSIAQQYAPLAAPGVKS